VSKLSNAIISIFRKGEKRNSSQEFEQAVNQVLLSDTMADATKKPIITPEGSLAISAVWACVRILSETVGTLPIHLYHKTSSGREQAKGHPCAGSTNAGSKRKTLTEVSELLSVMAKC